MRERPDAIARSRASRTLAVFAMSTMSIRGTMTSRTMVSPNSITDRMKLRSSEAMASSSCATSAMARTSDSVIRWVWPVVPKSPITTWAMESSNVETHLMGQNFSSAPTTGAVASAALSGYWTAKFFGMASKMTKMTITSPTVAMKTPAAPNNRSARTPTMVADTSWQISTSKSSGLRNFSGASASATSAFDPRRPWSRRDRARDLFIRTSDVSASAKKPDSTSSTSTLTAR